MTWTRAKAVLALTGITLAVCAVGSAPARAADLGGISVTTLSPPVPEDPGPPPIPEIPGVYEYTPMTLTGEVGDTFTVINNTSDSRTLSVSYGGADTGSVSAGPTDCTPDQATCNVMPGSTLTYTITKLGTISLTAVATVDLLPQPIGQITLQPAGGGTSPSIPTFTATANANGGSCSGTTTWWRIPGSPAYPGVFALPTSSQCTRSGYSLAGWSTSPSATSATFAPGASYSMSDSDVTLYAVWQPNGVQITYDANVGMSAQCLAGGANIATAAGRRSTSVVQPGSNSATTAPCTPVDSRLAGWAYTGNGSAAFTGGQSLPATLTSGSTVTLFAKWETVYDLSVSPSSVKFRRGGSAVVTFTATVNGAPAPGRDLALSTSGDPVSLSPGPSVGATTDAAGKVSVTISKRFEGEATVTATFGDATATVDVSAVDSATIDITGERGTVAGKSGVIVNGTTTGFTAGDTVVPYVRFPGQEYFQDSARPEIAADGSFEWQRKTGKKTYVYFTSADGTLTSNRIIIAAQ